MLPDELFQNLEALKYGLEKIDIRSRNATRSQAMFDAVHEWAFNTCHLLPKRVFDLVNSFISSGIILTVLHSFLVSISRDDGFHIISMHLYQFFTFDESALFEIPDMMESVKEDYDHSS
jgi:hypothetical protein